MHFNVRKAMQPRVYVYSNIEKATPGGKKALAKLNSFLNAASPEPAYFLYRLYNNQQNAITYKELREAIENGYMSEAALQGWQNDYQAFVNQHLKPIWIDAMKAHAEDLEAKHPTFFFDPAQPRVQDWINNHGAQWVTNQSQQCKEAIAAMINYSTTEIWTVDELARAIRPTIGLTKPQAAANIRFYENTKKRLLQNNPGMRDATAAKRAQDAAIKYAAKQHRYRAQTIAQTELAFAYNRGMEEAMRQAYDQHLVGKWERRWATARDHKVCEICEALDGVAAPMDDKFNLPGLELFEGMHETPPAHPRCRCALEYIEKEKPDTAALLQDMTLPAEATGTMVDAYNNAVAAPGAPTNAPKPPGKVAIPQGLQGGTAANLGGTGTMYAYTDAAGQEWLFKPAQAKYSGAPEAFRAHAQEAAYKVQYIVDPETSTRVGTGVIDGEFGAFQEKIKTTQGVDLKHWQHSGGAINAETLSQLQREHVTDWLCCNYDSHGGNFIWDEAGKLRGIDKEQAFRYIDEVGAQKMSYSFHPNAKYGETEPIYNTIYRKFANGDIDIRLQDTLVSIKRVEAIPDAEYREMFREYAESLHGKGSKAEALLDKIVERKQNLREEYREFYSKLLTQRTGKKQVFVWADEAAATKGQPVAAVLHTQASLQKMSMTELKQLAKAQKVAYYNNMNKAQLITSIADPTQAPAMSAQVKARLSNNAAARAARPKPVPAKPKDVVGASDLFADFGYVPKNDPYGTVVHSDAGSVEGLGMTARNITIDKHQYYEIHGKFTRDEYDKVLQRMSAARKEELEFERIDTVTKEFYKDKGMGFAKRTIKDGQAVFEIYDNEGGGYDTKHGWMGYFRVRVPDTGDPVADAKAAREFLERNGLAHITKTPTAEAEAILKKKRLIWQHAPSRVDEYQGLTGKALSDKLDDIMRSEHISQSRLSNMVFEKVANGYGTYVEKGIAKEYRKDGLTYVWSSISGGEDTIAVILKNGGMASTNNRCKGGFFDPSAGASSFEDMRTGGSDNVFTRIGVKNAGCTFNDCPIWGKYRIAFRSEVMERTDWYAFESDRFGETSPSLMRGRLPARKFISEMNRCYARGNEIMFRHGIPISDFEAIYAQNNRDRDVLINRLKADGITSINGTPLDIFIKVRTMI